MATAPAPFPTFPPAFFPTTAPECFFLAPTQIHGYCYPSPFPYPAYAPGPVFPPPPCGFGVPAPGFFPAPAYGPSTSPFAASSYPTEFGSVPPRPPTSAPLTIGAPATSETPATAPLHRPDQAPLPTDLCSRTPRLLDAMPTAPSREHLRPPQSAPSDPSFSSPSANLSSSKTTFHTSVPRMQPDTVPATLTGLPPKLPGNEVDAFERHATDLFLNQLPSSSPATARYSNAALSSAPLDCLLGDVSDHTPEVTAFQSAGATAGSPASSLSSPFAASTLKFASFSATNASTMPSATGSVAPQVFGEMPTPRSVYDYCSGHHNTTLSTCVPDSNLSEQNLDGMPQAYGLHNLNRQSVFRADGTEHHYYVLPKTYPLARATPQPGFNVCDEETKDCLNEFGDVFTSSLEQPAISFHKAPERESIEQLVKCLSKAPENEQTSKYMRKAFENERHSAHSTVSATATDLLQFQAFERLPMFDVDDDKTDGCSSVFVGVFASTPEQQIHDEEQHESEQRHKYSSEHSKNPLPQVVSGLTLPDNAEADVSRYIKFTHGQCIQKIVKSDLGHGYAMGDVPHLKTYKLNMLLSDEGREVWDPGTSASLHSSKGNFCWHQDVKFNGIALWLITFNPP